MREETITVFAGAGASKAVDSAQYPTTVEFFQQLPPEIRGDPLFNRIVEFLKTESKMSIVDIELVLWRLEELAEFCALATDQKQLPGWLLNEHRLLNSIGLGGSNIGHLRQIATTALSRVSDLRDGINAEVYRLYGELPQVDRLKDTWVPLLRPLLKVEAKIELVTTNYDVILEDVLDLLGRDLESRIDTGWRGTIQRTLDTTLWSQHPEKGLLTKLHGSVNWTRDGTRIYIGDPTFKGSHKRHVIIYPGFKGRPSDPIFQAFHAHFGNALARSHAVLFVGFAFRDEFINELCERHISGRCRVLIIDPSSTLVLPFAHQESLTHRIEKEFNAASAEEAVSILIGGAGM